MVVIALFLLLGSASATIFSTGPLEDAQCNVEAVERANTAQLSSILSELMESTYFRLVRIKMDDECPFWDHNDATCETPSFGPGEQSACSLSLNEPFSSAEWAWSSPTDYVDLTISLEEEELSRDSGCDDENLPTFWLDMCSDISTDSPDLINLNLNPEHYTGYNGSHIWDAIYKENCFSRSASLDEMCYEERVLYRLLSGMHASTNIHINMKYFPPRKGKRAQWEPNPSRFFSQYGNNVERLQNLHFAFVVMLRALKRAAPHISEMSFDVGIKEEDIRTNLLVQRLLDSHILHSCSEVFEGFDESMLFQSEAEISTQVALKRQFKGVFQNISRALDCVTCQQCKLHGKLTLLGLGTALKILLLPEHILVTSLVPNELVAFFNTLASFSEAIEGASTLSRLHWKDYNEEKERHQSLQSPTQSVLPPRSIVNICVGAIANAAAQGALSSAEEDTLIDLALARNLDLLMLAEHYHRDPLKLIHHARRNINRLSLLASPAVDCDAVIVGGGLAGLTAALSLLDRGARVVLLDKENFLGGNSAKASSGINGIDSTGVAQGDSVDTYAKDTLRSGALEESEHVRVLTSDSVDALAWVRTRLGLPLELLGQLGGHSYARTHRPSSGMAGIELIYAVQREIKKFGPEKLEIIVNAKVTQLTRDEHGRVNGVGYIQGNTTSTLSSTSVVLATGGYSYHEQSSDDESDPSDLLAEYRSDLIALATSNGPWATGDGHRLAQSVGASLIDMQHVQVHPTGFVDPADPSASVKLLCAEILRGVGGILLTSSGQRFANELGTRDYLVAQMREAEPETLQFSILVTASSAEQIQKHIDFYTKKGVLRRFDSLEDLASAMSLEVAVLLESFAAHNEAASAGVDRFGKTVFAKSPYTADSAPFYLGTVTPIVHYTMGGIATDTAGRVLSSAGTPVPGLYSAGEAVGGIHGKNRLGGNALTECIVYGRLVGNGIEFARSRVDLPATAAAPAATSAAGRSVSQRTVSSTEVAAHSEDTDCWVTLFDTVYDLSGFAEEHPGGTASILGQCGTDGTELFETVHTRVMLEDFDVIGQIQS